MYFKFVDLQLEATTIFYYALACTLNAWSPNLGAILEAAQPVRIRNSSEIRACKICKGSGDTKLLGVAN